MPFRISKFPEFPVEFPEFQDYTPSMDILPQLLVNGLVAGAIYALVAMGFSLIYGTTRFFNLAHGPVAVAGGYGVFLFSGLLQWPLSVGIILGILFAGVFGWGLDKLVYLPLRRRKASGMILLVASLGLFTVIPSMLAIAFGTSFHNLASGSTITTLHLGSVLFTHVQLLGVLASLVVFMGLMLAFRLTRLGRAVRAVSDDEEVAKIIGINTNRIIAVTFFVGSAIAGVAGVLTGFDTGLQPATGLALLLKGVIAAIVGGIGSVPGALLGGFLVGVVENLGIWQIGAEWKEAIAFILLILFLIFRPEGIIKRR